ncbi:hypothetical protein LOTGIDRAFT_166622 [Lottia gigantea]|uniref:Uncharacterized protein n=1 Tax=Lottia gigantea TaxID=225164 RepID=V3Z994_LOTGI|nr:hypothetical protein LOTGIDRAFT_166622 [Lottia gigantea]ESO87468.1 hypothetical protein LOTGIDRAFT_166622 [Lottia gigantea]
MVARVTVHNMRQDRDEPVRSFGPRGQAGVCKFVIQCTNCDTAVNYTDEILRDALTRGIADHDIQLDILGDKNQNMTLEEVFKFVEAQEAGKRSASHLIDSHITEAASSSTYKKTKQKNVKDKPDLCSYCGKTGHGKNALARIRKTVCPAYGHKAVESATATITWRARSKDRRKAIVTPSKADDCEGAVFDALCSITSSRQPIAIDHHIIIIITLFGNGWGNKYENMNVVIVCIKVIVNK